MSRYRDAQVKSSAMRHRYREVSSKPTQRRFASIYWLLFIVFLVYLIIFCLIG